MASSDRPYGDSVTPARITTTRGRVKGALFREFIRYCEERYDVSPADVASRLPPDLRELVDFSDDTYGILASAWYPAELAIGLLDVFLSDLPGEEHALVLREGTRYSLERTFTSLHRATFRLFVNPERAARHVQTLWRLNCDTGTVTWRITAKGRCESHLRGWASHDRNLCEIARLSAAYAFEMMGCRDVHSERFACISRGDPLCGSVITWR